MLKPGAQVVIVVGASEAVAVAPGALDAARHAWPQPHTSGARQRYGPDNNFAKSKEKLSRAAIEMYGDLGRLMETGEYFEPPELSIEDYDLENDKHEVNVVDYREDRKDCRGKFLAQMEADMPKMYVMILGKLSTESMDELKRQDYEGSTHAMVGYHQDSSSRRRIESSKRREESRERQVCVYAPRPMRDDRYLQGTI